MDTSADHVLDLYKRSQACCEANKSSNDSPSPHYNMGNMFLLPSPSTYNMGNFFAFLKVMEILGGFVVFHYCYDVVM